MKFLKRKRIEEIGMQLVLGSGRREQDIGVFTVPSKGLLSYNITPLYPHFPLVPHKQVKMEGCNMIKIIAITNIMHTICHGL